MVPRHPKENFPSPVTSSEEEEEDDVTEDNDDEDDVMTPEKQQAPKSGSESGSGSGSDSDSDTDLDSIQSPNVFTTEPNEPMVEHDELDNYPRLSEWLNTSSELLRGIFSQALRIMDKEKISQLEERFRMLRIDELELYVKRLDLTSETARLVLEAIRT